MAKYFNTAFSLSMVATPFQLSGKELTVDEARAWLQEGHIVNVANPNHANTLDAVSKKLGIDVRGGTGDRVSMGVPGSQMLVAQVIFPPSVPRETKEYTNEHIALGKFSLILVEIN